MNCDSCEIDFEQLLVKISNDNKKAVQIFLDHGVIPSRLVCPKCHSDCSFREDQNVFRCRKINFKTKRKCLFQTSRFKGTWFENSHVEPQVQLRFINIYLRKFFSQYYCQQFLNLPSETVVNLKSYCGEVCEFWLHNQKPIGGQNTIVEIDERHCGHSKNNQGRKIKGLWVFGGIERGTQNIFIVPIKNRNKETLIPLIQKYVLPGSKIISDDWRAYSELSSLGYAHKVINHSENFVDPIDSSSIHTRNIKRKWKDIKSWVLKSGNRRAHYEKYFARYLFLSQHKKESTRLHHFLVAIATLYPGFQEKK